MQHRTFSECEECQTIHICQAWTPSSVVGIDVPSREIPLNKPEALATLEQALAELRDLPWIELSKRIGKIPTTTETLAPSGQWYQLEIQVFWDDEPGGDIRVIGAIDDGGIRSYAPLASDFITARSADE